MPTDFTFRLSTYLTLALACVCLGYAEMDLLPEVTAFSWGVAVAVGVAFVADRKGYELSLSAANWLGLVIGAATAVWLVAQMRRRDGLLHDEHMPWSAALLPYVGPVLLLLMLAKLFRPKHAGDWWGLQGVGLCAVGLAGALTDAEGLVVLAGLYVLVGVWSLTLFYIRRASGYVEPVPPAPARPGVVSLAYWVPWLFGGVRPKPAVAEAFEGVGRPTARERVSRSHFARSVRWLVVAAAVALPAFLLTPRSPGFQWELFRKMETGLPSDSGPDLSHTGDLRVNHDPAFEVTAAYPDGSPKDDLPADARFRVASYVSYKFGYGKWVKEPPPKVFSLPFARPDAAARSVTRPAFAWLGANRFYLDYAVVRKRQEDRLPGMPLLDPVAVRPDRPPPVAYPINQVWLHPYVLTDGTVSHLSKETGRLTRYTQAAAPPADDAVGPFDLHPEFGDPRRHPLVGGPFPSERIAGYARDLLPKLAAAGKLSPAVIARRHPFTLLPAADDHPAVARALRDHLSSSGEFAYTLSLKRQDRGADPVEDFLFNTKAGHCERFGAALVLLLRACEIPAQFTVGFRGCEAMGEGKYVVRQEHAHAWADALVGRPNAAGGRDWYWLPLDPTPDGAGPGGDDGDDSLLSAGTKKGKQLIADLIVGLDVETQKKITAAAKGFAAEYATAAVVGVGLLVAGWLAFRRVRRPVPVAAVAEPTPVPWYARLVELLSAAGHPPAAGQTPREYAASAAGFLRRNSVTEEVADVPTELVALLYRERYASAPLTPDEMASVSAALDRLSAAVAPSGTR